MKQNKKNVKTRNRAESERKLIEAAAKVFAKFGYDGATTRMIAEESGINLGLIQKYFGSKYNLLVALVKNGSKEVYATPLPYPQQSNLLDECLCYAEFHFTIQISHLELVKVVILQSLVDPRFSKDIRTGDFTEPQRQLKERIRPFFGEKGASEMQFLTDTVDGLIFAAIFIQHLMKGEKKEKCLNDLKLLISKIIGSKPEELGKKP